MSITGIVITLNEQNNIRDCIENMQTVCDEIIVVDSNSSDQTREIAAKLGAKVIVQEYLGDGWEFADAPVTTCCGKHFDCDGKEYLEYLNSMLNDEDSYEETEEIVEVRTIKKADR